MITALHMQGQMGGGGDISLPLPIIAPTFSNQLHIISPSVIIHVYYINISILHIQFLQVFLFFFISIEMLNFFEQIQT